MKQAIKRISATALGVAFLLGSAASARAIPVATPAPAPSTVSWLALAPNSESTFNPNATAYSTSNGLKLLGFIDWSQCYVFNNESWVIQSFATTYLGAKKTMSIQCGNQATQGYFHIALPASGRQQEWRNRITQAQPQANTDGWDDWMWWLAVQVSNAPEVSISDTNGKICRSAPIQMYGITNTGARVLKYTFRPSFVWSITQDRLITAIPSTSSAC